MASAETNKYRIASLPGRPCADDTGAVIQSTATIYSPDPTTSTDQSDQTSVTYTQQQSPLLRLPGELRNRIYDELFRTLFEQFEIGDPAMIRWDPMALRSLIPVSKVCRQTHQEAMAFLVQGYVAKQLYYRLWKQEGVHDFFTRTTLFCRTVKRYAPPSHFSARLICSERRYGVFAPEHAKAFVEELARQLQQVATVSFTSTCTTMTTTECDCEVGSTFGSAKSSDASAWDALWNMGESRFKVAGSVGGYRFGYKWCAKLKPRAYLLLLEGRLAQLDWKALMQRSRAAKSHYSW